MPDTNDGAKSAEKNFDIQDFLMKRKGASVSRYHDEEIVYAQGDSADALYYIVSGSVKVSVITEQGREGVVAILNAGDFFGEGCLSSRMTRVSTVTATSDCEVIRLDRPTIARALEEDSKFCKLFMEFLLGRNEKLKDDLLNQLFNSSEKRLARVLVTLASIRFGEQSNLISIPISQETLANMVGTTRSRINQFMIKFRKLGYIEYNGRIRVHNSLLNIILDNQSHGDAL